MLFISYSCELEEKKVQKRQLEKGWEHVMERQMRSCQLKHEGSMTPLILMLLVKSQTKWQMGIKHVSMETDSVGQSALVFPLRCAMPFFSISQNSSVLPVVSHLRVNPYQSLCSSPSPLGTEGLGWWWRWERLPHLLVIWQSSMWEHGAGECSCGNVKNCQWCHLSGRPPPPSHSGTGCSSPEEEEEHLNALYNLPTNRLHFLFILCNWY